MVMQIVNEDQLSVSLIQADSDVDIPECKILVNGELTDRTVKGAILEAAVSWYNHYLIFMTDDVPYEDLLNIYLLDKDLNLLDSARIGSIYSTGTFSALNLIEPNKVSFRFIGDTDWGIELLTEPVFSIPFITDPKGVSRKFSFKKQFLVSGNPVPVQRKESTIS